MLKILLLVLGFMIERYQHSFKSPIVALTEKWADEKRKILLSVAGGLIGVIVLAAGIVVSLVDMGSQYDRNGFIQFSGILWAGLGMFLIPSMGIAIYVVRDAARVAKAKKESRESPWNQLVALMITDVTKYFEEKLRKSEAPATTAAPVYPENNGKVRAEPAYTA